MCNTMNSLSTNIEKLIRETIFQAFKLCAIETEKKFHLIIYHD